MSKKNLYVITNLNTGADGRPFALCKPHYEEWKEKISGKIYYREIGKDTKEPCNECEE